MFVKHLDESTDYKQYQLLGYILLIPFGWLCWHRELNDVTTGITVAGIS